MRERKKKKRRERERENRELMHMIIDADEFKVCGHKLELVAVWRPADSRPRERLCFSSSLKAGTS